MPLFWLGESIYTFRLKGHFWRFFQINREDVAGFWKKG